MIRFVLALTLGAALGAAGITLVAASPNVVSVNPAVPAKTVQELIALIKANPGKYSFASAGTGNKPSHRFVMSGVWRNGSNWSPTFTYGWIVPHNKLCWSLLKETSMG